MAATTVSLVLKEKVKYVDGKATETRNTQVAGTYFNNDNATSVAMDVFKGVLEEAGKPSTDEDLEAYGGLNDQEFLCEYVTKEADADGFLTRVRTEAHAVGDVDPEEDDEDEFDDEDEEGDFGDGAPAAYPPASEDDGEEDYEAAGAPADDQGEEGDEEEEEEEEEEPQQQQKRKKM